MVNTGSLYWQCGIWYLKKYKQRFSFYLLIWTEKGRNPLMQIKMDAMSLIGWTFIFIDYNLEKNVKVKVMDLNAEYIIIMWYSFISEIKCTFRRYQNVSYIIICRELIKILQALRALWKLIAWPTPYIPHQWMMKPCSRKFIFWFRCNLLSRNASILVLVCLSLLLYRYM